ncbi:MAG: GNAT family N-acetyltransferase [Alphaproteobacteria bacterium]|nr:GNAT family N-acetyltransferase [Alphaproteobacteria bacterium]
MRAVTATLIEPSRDLVFTLGPLPDLEELDGMWRSLDRVGTHSFFVTWTWIGALLRTVPDHGHVMLLAVSRGSQAVGLALVGLRNVVLGGVLPVRRACLNSLGDAELDCVEIEHNGFAATVSDDALWPSLMDWFAASPLDEMVVPGLATGRAGRTDGNIVRLARRSQGHRAPLEQVRAGGVASLLSRNARQQLGRSMRAYEVAAPVVLEVAADVPTALDYFAGLKELHIRSWHRRGRRHAFDAPYFEVFHRALIEAGVAEGSVDLLRVSAGSRVFGYLYNFRRNGVVSSYQSGFDDDDPDLRPGYVCHAKAISHYAAQGMSRYDFLAGTNRLKETFGKETYELCWCHFRKPNAAFRAEALARRAVGFLRRARKG